MLYSNVVEAISLILSCLDILSVFLFSLGFIIGLILCSIMLGVVASGVNTTIVLYAEAPSEFQENHHDLSNKMRAAWLEAYPGIIS